MGKELVPTKSEKLHTLTQLSAWENFNECCHHGSFKTYTIKVDSVQKDQWDYDWIH